MEKSSYISLKHRQKQTEFSMDGYISANGVRHDGIQYSLYLISILCANTIYIAIVLLVSTIYSHTVTIYSQSVNAIKNVLLTGLKIISVRGLERKRTKYTQNSKLFVYFCNIKQKKTFYRKTLITYTEKTKLKRLFLTKLIIISVLYARIRMSLYRLGKGCTGCTRMYQVIRIQF